MVKSAVFLPRCLHAARDNNRESTILTPPNCNAIITCMSSITPAVTASKSEPAIIETPHAVVVLTGAGISAESGIETFRATDGLWYRHRVEDVAYPEGFRRNPDLVHAFYNERRHQLLSGNIQPNPAHTALARFEQGFAGEFLLVTQNVDNLHEAAGSRNVLHMHGDLLSMRCLRTGEVFPIRGTISARSQCECCGQAGTLRPDVVWFGEMPYHMDQIEQALQACDLFVSIGTSGKVYPAAGFYQTVKWRGVPTVEINLESTGSSFDTCITGPASTEVPAFFDGLLADIRNGQDCEGYSALQTEPFTGRIRQ